MPALAAPKRPHPVTAATLHEEALLRMENGEAVSAANLVAGS